MLKEGGHPTLGFTNVARTTEDALFLDQCIGWSEQKVANLPHVQAPELGKWFMKGQAIGERPIFDGMCAMCGTLLHGEANLNTSACSNKRFGSPVDRDGNKLSGCNDCVQGKQQPPCLLRPRLVSRVCCKIATG